jgi:hypothetical protein
LETDVQEVDCVVSSRPAIAPAADIELSDKQLRGDRNMARNTCSIIACSPALVNYHSRSLLILITTQIEVNDDGEPEEMKDEPELFIARKKELVFGYLLNTYQTLQ